MFCKIFQNFLKETVIFYYYFYFFNFTKKERNYNIKCKKTEQQAKCSNQPMKPKFSHISTTTRFNRYDERNPGSMTMTSLAP